MKKRFCIDKEKINCVGMQTHRWLSWGRNEVDGTNRFLWSKKTKQRLLKDKTVSCRVALHQHTAFPKSVRLISFDFSSPELMIRTLYSTCSSFAAFPQTHYWLKTMNLFSKNNHNIFMHDAHEHVTISKHQQDDSYRPSVSSFAI